MIERICALPIFNITKGGLERTWVNMMSMVQRGHFDPHVGREDQLDEDVDLGVNAGIVHEGFWQRVFAMHEEVGQWLQSTEAEALGYVEDVDVRENLDR
eukprot:3889215-Amphidinium_carterae.2